MEHICLQSKVLKCSKESAAKDGDVIQENKIANNKNIFFIKRKG
jgi:hypothetical protein